MIPRPFLRALAAALVLVAGKAIAEEPAAKSNVPDPSTMTTYVVGFLKRGPGWTPGDSPELQKIQEGHMANIRRMHEMGKLILAGPFSDGGELRGMFVFYGGSLDEIRALVDQDPAVKAGRLVLELHPWYSAKGIGIVPPPKQAP
jgi:uncharacterized protein YciI